MKKMSALQFLSFDVLDPTFLCRPIPQTAGSGGFRFISLPCILFAAGSGYQSLIFLVANELAGCAVALLNLAINFLETVSGLRSSSNRSDRVGCDSFENTLWCRATIHVNQTRLPETTILIILRKTIINSRLRRSTDLVHLYEKNLGGSQVQ